MSKYKPWEGENEWRDRQERKQRRDRAAYLAHIGFNPDAKCMGCLKQMHIQDHGKVVQSELGDELGVRCLNCQIKNR